MIRNEKGWHYLAVKKLSVLLRGITSKHHGGFYCLISLIISYQKTNLYLINSMWK